MGRLQRFLPNIYPLALGHSNSGSQSDRLEDYHQDLYESIFSKELMANTPARIPTIMPKIISPRRRPFSVSNYDRRIRVKHTY